MKKPDRFEREIGKINFRLHVTAPWLITESQALKLLRKEHRWVERMVKSEKVSGETGTEGDIAYNTACDHILERLRQRRK